MNVGSRFASSMTQSNNIRTNAGSADDVARITLGLLDAVGANSSVTQRRVAGELGIALGLANAYLKRCIRKGLIKVQDVPANRYAYYLTRKGFAEKTRLTAEYLSASFNFFRGAREQCTALLDHCQAQGWRRIALAGTGDLTEIAALCAQDHMVEIVGIVDDQLNSAIFAGMPVVRRLKELGAVNAVMICDMRAPQATFDTLIGVLPREQVLAPPLLRISLTPPTLVK
jgi:DNA-binding MarR family transcriptional regulator